MPRSFALCCALAVASAAGAVLDEDIICLPADEEGNAIHLLQRKSLRLRSAPNAGLGPEQEPITDSATPTAAAALAATAAGTSEDGALAFLDTIGRRALVTGAASAEEEMWRSAVASAKAPWSGDDAEPQAVGSPKATAASTTPPPNRWDVMCNEWLNGVAHAGATVDCPAGLKCVCSAINPANGRWYCNDKESRQSCAHVAEAPTSYPSKVFFASFKADMLNAAAGRANIWNTTGWWVLDIPRRRQRIDTQTHVRALSSDAFLATFHHSNVSLPNRNGWIDTFDAKVEDLFAGKATPQCRYGRLATLATQPLIGTAARFLPPDAADVWKSHPDRFLGFDVVAGVNCSVWGWTELQLPGEVAGHKVWLDAATGFPVREEQWQGTSPYGTFARVTFSGFEDLYGSYPTLEGKNLFNIPASCGRGPAASKTKGVREPESDAEAAAVAAAAAATEQA